MSVQNNVIHSVEKERERIAQIANNPRIVAAYRQAQNEGDIIDKLLDIFGINVKERHDKMALSHLGADHVKLIADFRSSRFDPSLSAVDRGTIHELLQHAVADMDRQTSSLPPPSPKRSRQI